MPWGQRGPLRRAAETWGLLTAQPQGGTVLAQCKHLRLQDGPTRSKSAGSQGKGAVLSLSCILGHQEREERLGDSTGWRRGSGTMVGHSARAGCSGWLWVWGRGARTRAAALGGGAGVREAILGWGHDAESGEMLLSVAGRRRWVLGTSGCALQRSRGRARAAAKGWAGMADLVWGRGAGPVSCQTYWGVAS